MQTTITLLKCGITDVRADAIVNAANELLAAGGGVCGAIFQAAGREELQEACNAYGHCETGSAVITPGFRLPAKYIIHAVGPRWAGGKHGEPEQLRGAYRKSLELALEHGCRSIAFPLISSGIFGYPLEPAWREALTTCLEFEKEHPDALKIFFAVPGDGLRALGRKTLQSLIGGTERQSEGLTPETLARIRKFTEDRDWDQFHTPANLAKSIAIEAAELLECFQWSDTEYDLEHVKEELADVIVYCQDLLDKLDLNVNEIVNSKMSKNEAKYPVEQAKGSAAKYTELKEAGK